MSLSIVEVEIEEIESVLRIVPSLVPLLSPSFKQLKERLKDNESVQILVANAYWVQEAIDKLDAAKYEPVMDYLTNAIECIESQLEDNL